MTPSKPYDIPIYSTAARHYHWWVAALIAIQFPIGLYMVYRGEEMVGVNDKGEPVKGVWDALTGTLYSSHKIIGLIILLVVLLRLGYRLTQGAPRSDPGVPPALIGISHLVHWLIYVLLIVVPIGGYLGISYGNYLDIFGVQFPALTPENKDMSEEIFEYHELGAKILLALVTLHIGGALYHKYIRKDRVVERMLPKKNMVA
ncbi:MAG TPA: cytochrome b [Hyphomicrobium sp.]|nr:cytochrome b [Hyphomicrobium sp.]